MSKRKISIQQQRVIRQQQEKKTQDKYQSGVKGLVICHYGVQAAIKTLPLNNESRIIQCHKRTHIDITAGDEVFFEVTGDDTGVIVARAARKNALSRATKHKSDIKTLAANIDQAFIVFSVEPASTPLFTDQLLVGCGMLNITPILIMNKADLTLSNSTAACFTLAQKAKYEAAGYNVLSTSIYETNSMLALRAACAHRTSIFVGQSGVGKSSLLNHLIPEAQAKTNAISEEHKIGKHTTIHSELYELKDGGIIIDSPGIREWQCSEIHSDALKFHFPEFLPWLDQCRFRNCTHQKEPQCMIKQKVEEGAIHHERWENFCLLQTQANIKIY